MTGMMRRQAAVEEVSKSASWNCESHRGALASRRHLRVKQPDQIGTERANHELL
jgi:hypothetical protein